MSADPRKAETIQALPRATNATARPQGESRVAWGDFAGHFIRDAGAPDDGVSRSGFVAQLADPCWALAEGAQAAFHAGGGLAVSAMMSVPEKRSRRRPRAAMPPGHQSPFQQARSPPHLPVGRRVTPGRAPAAGHRASFEGCGAPGTGADGRDVTRQGGARCVAVRPGDVSRETGRPPPRVLAWSVRAVHSVWSHDPAQ